MGKFVDRTGERFGRLVVVGRGISDTDVLARWKCLCDCGNEIITRYSSLSNGRSKSCGCLALELNKQKKSHGMCKTPEYKTWQAMKDRCYNPNNRRYKRYGYRGIKVCNRWLESFDNFLADMGCKPTTNHSLDRINNDGDYELENCRWATPKEQNNNTSRTRTFNIDGKEKKIVELADEHGISQALIQHRLLRGKSIDEAVSTKKERRNIVITVDGVTDTVKAFSEKYGIKHLVVLNRLNRGKTPEEAVKTPVRSPKL